MPIVSPHIRVRHPDHFTVGEHSIVDDYSYFSTRVTIGVCSHVASGCTVGGGAAHLFSLGDFSSVSAGVRIWCASNDFVNDVVAILPPGLEAEAVECTPITGDVTFSSCTGIGANSVVMPGNTIPEGTVIGATSFVPSRFPFEPWGVYAGTPVRRVADRNQPRVLRQVERIREHLRLA